MPKQSEDKKGWPCLVLDLDETLIHFQEDEDSGQFLIRPYAKEFLVQMAKFYEIGESAPPLILSDLYSRQKRIRGLHS